ncbi:hypothetical protein O6H91_23G018400 [Diphasiastrum complanatum]|nr:hypothetical protein O6H91_23G018400 [Diphasiastrum complanatum]
MQEASESGSRVAPPRNIGTFQNERGRYSSGRFPREMQQARSFSPKNGAGRRENDAMNEGSTYRGSRKPYQGSAGYSHDPKKFYGSGEARGSVNSRIGYERRPDIKRRDSFNHNSRGRTEREETGTASRIRYDRRPEYKHRDSFNHNSKGRTEREETRTNSRIRYERYPEIKDTDSFDHNSEGTAEREETETGFGRLGKTLSSNSFQSGRKERGPRFDSLHKDRNRSKFERGETRLLPVDTRTDREKRQNSRNRIILKRPFEEFEEVQTNVRRGGQQDSEYDESNGEEHAKKKLDALIKDLSGLYFGHVNKALKDKAKWIEGEEVKQIVEHVLGSELFSHAYQVLRWAEKQYWFEADFELITKVCNACSHKGVISGARGLFDMLKRSLLAPEASTYAALINAYLKEGREESVKSAWELYHEMKQQGGYEPSSDVKFSLFCALTEKPQKSLKWLEQADGLFETIKSSGVAPSTEMYASLIHLHALNSDAERVIDLLQEMKASGLIVSSDIFRIVLNMWAKVGDYQKMEEFYAENIDVDEPDWYNYVLLIEAYLKGGLRSKALQVLDEMVLSVGTLKKEMYEAAIRVMAQADEREYAENLLKEFEETNCHSSQSAYNAVMEMYVRQHLFDEAEMLFERMETKGCRPDEDSYNSLIMLHLERGQFEKAEEAYERMLRKETLNPNQKTYSLMLEAFGKAGQLAKVCQVYEQLSSHNYAVPFELRQYLKAAGRLKETITGPKLESRPRLEKSQREILAGVLLGGAQIASSNGGLSNEIHFELSSVSPVGKTLFYHLHQEFVRWAKDSPALKPVEGLNGTSMENQVLHFSTLSHPTFRFFARQYRPKGKPTIPRMIARWLSSRTLAYWYMYGGYKCSETGRIVLNASCYSIEELLPVVRTLKATLVKRDSGNVIHFYGNSEVSFWTVVKPFILPELVDILQPRDDRFECTDNDSWEEFEGAIIDETQSDVSAAELVDATEEVGTNGYHQGPKPIKLSNLQLKAEVGAQTSINAIGKNEERNALAKPSIWERLAEIVQTDTSK